MNILRHRTIGLHRPDTVNAGDRGDDDHIIPLQQRPRRRMAHPVDLFVNLALFLDVGVGPRDIGFRLVVVVVADKILDRVVREEPLELPIKLRGERLVRGQNDRGALRLFNDLRHGEGLTGARRAQENLIPLPIIDAV